MTMTPRERVEAALRRQPVDFVPFTVYESKLPMCAIDRQTRNDGLCVVERRTNVFGGGARTSPLTSETHGYVDDRGHWVERRIYHTPAGDLSTLIEPLGYTTWTHEHLFKSAADYDALLCFIEGETYVPTYDAFLATRRRWGEDAFCRAGTPNIPIQTLISHYMGTMTFSLEWMDHRDDVLRVMQALHRQYLATVHLIAESPAVAVNLGGNHTPDILGRRDFENHVVEVWEETCALLQPKGILVGSHMDGNNRLWADLMAASSMDYFEAVTPAPDCDLTLAECREAWPDKILWLNFPSSQHLRPAAEIEAITHDLLRQAGDGRGLLMGVTEDVPPDRWEESYATILRACRDAGPR